MYDRNVAGRFAPARAGSIDSALLLSRVCFLTMGAVLCTVLGAAVTWGAAGPLLWFGALIGSFIMLFVCQAVARRFPVNLVALSVFAFLEGMFLGPILAIYAHVNGPLIIVEAGLLSLIIFAMVGALGYTSARSYAHWVPWLMGGLFALILGGIVLWFVASDTAHWVYSVCGAVLFTVFIFVDFTRIRHDFSAEDYIPATLKVYLDLINLFLFILRLLGRRR